MADSGVKNTNSLLNQEGKDMYCTTCGKEIAEGEVCS